MRYVAAVVSVSSVLFFSASIPVHPGHPDPGERGTAGGDLAAAHLLGILLAALCGRLALALGWLG